MISLIKNDKKFFDFKDSESLLEKMGFANNHQQALAIKMGTKLEKATTNTVLEYAKINNIKLEKRPAFIIKAGEKKKWHKGDQQIDYHFSCHVCSNQTNWLAELKANPFLDTGKQKSVINELENAYNEIKSQNRSATIKLGYASLSYSSSSPQSKRMLKVKEALRERGINCQIYTLNTLITETLGVSASEFSELDLANSIGEIGVYIRKELAQ